MLMELGQNISVVLKLVSVLIIIKLRLQAEARLNPGIHGIENKVFCQGQRLKFHCANSTMAIKIYTALYGRAEKGHVICPYVGAEDDDSYYCPEDNVTERLRQICEKRNRCRVKVNSAIFGDPCPDKHLYLNLVYACEWQKKRQKIATSPKIAPVSTSGNLVSTPTQSMHDFSTIRSFPTMNMTSSATATSHILVSSTIPRTEELSPVYTTSTVHVNNTTASVIGNSIIPVLDEQASSSQNDGVSSLGILGALLVWFMFMEDHASDYTTVFFVSAAAALCISLIVGFYIIYRHTGNKPRQQMQVKKELKLAAIGSPGRALKGHVDPHILGPMKTPPPDYMLEEVNSDRTGTLPNKNTHEAMMLRTYSDRAVYPRDLTSDSYC